MKDVLETLRAVPRRTWLLYALTYAPIGLMNQRLGQYWKLAEFRHDWQVLTCYVLYLVPWSLAVRRLRLAEQFVWGLLCLALIELPGYALGTSIAYAGNVVDAWVGERNFTLVMTLGFAAFLPAGNLLVGSIERWLFRPETSATPARAGAEYSNEPASANPPL
jgi:hypothetical protein